VEFRDGLLAVDNSFIIKLTHPTLNHSLKQKVSLVKNLNLSS